MTSTVEAVSHPAMRSVGGVEESPLSGKMFCCYGTLNPSISELQRKPTLKEGVWLYFPYHWGRSARGRQLPAAVSSRELVKWQSTLLPNRLILPIWQMTCYFMEHIDSIQACLIKFVHRIPYQYHWSESPTSHFRWRCSLAIAQGWFICKNWINKYALPSLYF